jgi:hypothetical protein
MKKSLILAMLLVGFLASYSAFAFASSNVTSKTYTDSNFNQSFINASQEDGPTTVQTYSGNDSQVVVLSNHTGGTVPFVPLTKYEPSFKVINITSSEGNITNPEIAASSKNVYIIYNNDGEGKLDVFVAQSRDFGVTYDPPVSLSMNLTGNSTNYEIGAAGDTAYIIFENGGAGNGDIFYGVTFDAGETWSVYNISNSPDPSYNSTLNVDEKGEAYIAWVEKNNSTTLYAYCTRWCW